MAEKYGSRAPPIEVRGKGEGKFAIGTIFDDDPFLRFHSLEADRSAGEHEGVDALSYLEMMAKKNEKLKTYKTAAEMMGMGTTNVVAGNYFPNYRPVVKIPVIMTGTAAAIVAHYAGYPKEGDIIKDPGHESPFVLFSLAPTGSARSPDEPKPERVRLC